MENGSCCFYMIYTYKYSREKCNYNSVKINKLNFFGIEIRLKIHIYLKGQGEPM